MATTTTKRPAGRPRENAARARVELQVDEAWLTRAVAAAKAQGFGSLSALIRVAVIRYLDACDAGGQSRPTA